MSTRAKRPYLLRALYDWLVDSGLTPYLLVDATGPGVQVPADYVTEGRIVLNIGPNAVRHLDLGNERVCCDGRFGGRPFPLDIPMAAVLAIYAKESGEGMMFDAEPGLEPSQGAVDGGSAEPDKAADGASAADKAGRDDAGGDSSGEEPPRDGSHLRIVK